LIAVGFSLAVQCPLVSKLSTKRVGASRIAASNRTETEEPVKRFAVVIAVALLSLSLASTSQPAHAGVDGWIRVRSRNFLLVGNATELEIRLIAARLEQFREVFKRLLPVVDVDDSLSRTTVLVFRDDVAYRPFEPLYQGQPNDAVGYFLSSHDANYITLSADPQHTRGADDLAVHEYVHLFVNNSFGRIPLWLGEGLSEFYSTFEVTNNNRKVKLGQPIKSRERTLRQRELLPLKTLFSVDDLSPYYNEPGRRDIFYAQSWALVHYLLTNRDQQRRTQLLRYLELSASGQSHDEAFQKAFETDAGELENELRQYIERGRYAEQSVAFAEPLAFDTSMQSAPLTEAESQFYLGDLLLHAHRAEAAETHLQAALKLDENLAPAYAALGTLRLRQNRYAEAVRSLERAVALDPQNYLTHYTYAEALSREGAPSDSLEGYYSPAALRIMRAELKKAIELAPRFVESYRLLAFINLVMNEQLDEAGALLKQALMLAPQRRELNLLLAQVHLRTGDFQSARQLLSTLLETTAGASLRTQSQALLETIAKREELARQLKLEAAHAALEDQPTGLIQPCDAPQPGPQKKPLRFSGEQICGMLVRVECDEGQVLLVVEAGTRTLRLHSAALNRIRFVTYTAEVRGQMTCGQREPATPVLVTYRSTTDGRAPADGEVLAVEFIPKEWNPPPAPAAP
jgi:tetratricopeptide (TPR) repeat protein